MKLFLRHACAIAAATLLGSTWVYAATPTEQTGKTPPRLTSPSETQKFAELFYEVLLGEFKASEGDPSPAYALLLDAARKNTDGALYKRATDIALKSRPGDAALARIKAMDRHRQQGLPVHQERAGSHESGSTGVKWT